MVGRDVVEGNFRRATTAAVIGYVDGELCCHGLEELRELLQLGKLKKFEPDSGADAVLVRVCPLRDTRSPSVSST